MTRSTAPAPTWSEHGVVAAGVGATVGASVAVLVALPLAHWASDAENGWAHDEHGWLVVPAALAVWAGTILGAAAGVRLARHPRAGSTAAGAVVALPAVALFLVVLTLPARTWFAAPALAGALARFLTPRR